MKRAWIFLFVVCFTLAGILFSQERLRLRETGINIGVLQPGPLNAITDVTGVKVGHVTLIQGQNVRTGVTAVLPHPGNIFRQKVPAAVSVANGFGKLTGFTQIEELGQMETPVILTNTLSVPTAADALIDYTLSVPGNEKVGSINPVVGETNDGYLNDIQGRHVKKSHVIEAIKKAHAGPLKEGAVGAGTGTICFGYKGGIGTSSRKLPSSKGGYTVGVLVQTNFGGILRISGTPVEIKLGQHTEDEKYPVGSCMMVVATDAPLESRNLKRLAKRALLGISRTGGYYSNSSGDYAIAFSTAEGLRMTYRSSSSTRKIEVLRNRKTSSLFLAAAEAAEEAILNSLFKAQTMEGKDGHTIQAIPLEKIKKIMKKEGRP